MWPPTTRFIVLSVPFVSFRLCNNPALRFLSDRLRAPAIHETRKTISPSYFIFHQTFFQAPVSCEFEWLYLWFVYFISFQSFALFFHLLLYNFAIVLRSTSLKMIFFCCKTIIVWKFISATELSGWNNFDSTSCKMKRYRSKSIDSTTMWMSFADRTNRQHSEKKTKKKMKGLIDRSHVFKRISVKERRLSRVISGIEKKSRQRLVTKNDIFFFS